MIDVKTPMTREQIAARMANVRRADTGIEVTLRSALHRRGLRFRKNVKGLPGSPDIVFPRRKVAVFVDGDFWHGWRFEERGHKLKPFWREKVERNMERDRCNVADLQALGWRVLRVWEHEVEERLDDVVERVLRLLDDEAA
ncbi:T/G mismatch-specific endonuclease [Deinococcus yavapaiensis KR-236]|uniref:T/G mismatch-specific endonuclease n=1 Tax=Deinococcus yavapaiensis KR-236 TaxID=694435 RepID=A0A318SK95_9DEIO|nr:very short patch repair endonuclease [Deinococcus yavapaiensis]PYE52978.1 T/G mismatch-specific endonuclease [Deinococcus yavapaiensis KR-236]